MAERLTDKTKDGKWYVCGINEASIMRLRGYGRIIVGLAIDKLSEYETAEKDGRLVVLQKCNIGDTVYLPIDFQNKIYTGTVEGFEYAKMRNAWVVKIRTDDEGICYEAFDDFGKTFFLDVEDAEKMLRR